MTYTDQHNVPLSCYTTDVRMTSPPPPTLIDTLTTRHYFQHTQDVELALVAPSSSIQLSATRRLLNIRYMCYEFRTPLLPGQLKQLRQSDLSVTSTLQSVNRSRHNEYSCCSHPSFSYRLPTHLLSRSDRWSDGLT